MNENIAIRRPIASAFQRMAAFFKLCAWRRARWREELESRRMKKGRSPWGRLREIPDKGHETALRPGSLHG